jgi:hypothetical protein
MNSRVKYNERKGLVERTIRFPRPVAAWAATEHEVQIRACELTDNPVEDGQVKGDTGINRIGGDEHDGHAGGKQKRIQTFFFCSAGFQKW